MTYAELAVQIGVPQESLSAVSEMDISDATLEEFEALFFKSQTAFEKRLKNMPNPNLAALRVYLQIAVKVYEDYQKLGISDSVFFDTFRDIAIWSEECQLQSHGPGLIQWTWNAFALRMELFRIGRLQYQPRVLTENLYSEKNVLPAGTPVLEVHIPAGAPLRTKEIRQSMEDAIQFYADKLGKRYSAFHCHSWLLANELKEILPADSGIMKFQSLFYVYKEDYDFHQAEERVFGSIQALPDGYPETTSLQRNLKKYLQDGGKVGMGAGIILCP